MAGGDRAVAGFVRAGAVVDRVVVGVYREVTGLDRAVGVTGV